MAFQFLYDLHGTGWVDGCVDGGNKYPVVCLLSPYVKYTFPVVAVVATSPTSPPSREDRDTRGVSGRSPTLFEYCLTFHTGHAIPLSQAADVCPPPNTCVSGCVQATSFHFDRLYCNTRGLRGIRD